MNKVKILLLLLISVFCLYTKDVYAASASLSVSSSKVYVGGSFKTTINVSASAAWSVHLKASGPVRNCSMDQADSTANALNANRSFSVTCTATGTGTITLTLSGDVTSADDGLARKVSGTRTVTVVQKTSNPTPSPSTPKPSGPEDKRSTNTSLKSLTVNGKSLTNKNNVYTLEVSNYIEKVDIAAVVSDSKAKLTGTGSKNLNVGENKFNIVVTAERGNKTTYTVKVIRKEFNTFDDFSEILKLEKDSEVQFSDKDKLTKEQIDSIVNSKRKITLTKYDSEKKKTLYSFILDGNTIKATGEFNPNLSLILENNPMEEAVNYAAGLYLDFSKCGNIPEGIILKYFVGDIYKDDEKVNLYSYSENKVTQVKEGLIVTNGYVEFNVSDSVLHLISKTKVMNAEVKEEGLNSWMVSSFVLAAIVVILVGLIIIDKMKMIKSHNEESINTLVKEQVETVVEEVVENKETDEVL